MVFYVHYEVDVTSAELFYPLVENSSDVPTNITTVGLFEIDIDVGLESLV